MTFVYSVILVGFLIIVFLRWLFQRRWLRDIHGRSVLITGCSSGLGRALALRLDQLGVTVFATCRTESASEELRASLSDRTTVLVLDVTDTASIQRAYRLVRRKLSSRGVLWGVVNNAGISDDAGPVEFTLRESYERVYSVNLVGMAEVTRIFLPLLKKSGGRVVNITCAEGRLARPDRAAYAASKFASEGYSDVLRREMTPYGIHVSVVEPEDMTTQTLDVNRQMEQRQRSWDLAPESLQRQYGPNYLQHIRQILESRRKKSNRSLSEVVQACVHALYAAKPRRRYLLVHNHFRFRLLTSLPDIVADTYLRTFQPRPLPLCLDKTEYW